MSRALSSSITPPPAPNPTPDTGANSDAAALSGQSPPPAGAPGASAQPPAPPPPPSHAQTVAALRHFRAIENEATDLLKDPDCGKADMKSAVIDGMTKLVREGIFTPAQAVKGLSDFPEKPFDQKKWLEAQVAHSALASMAVLQHHRAAFAGDPNAGATGYNPDDHAGILNGLTSQYGGARG